MKYNLKLVLQGAILLALFQACKQNVKNTGHANLSQNEHKIVVDESFRPIVDEELYIFRALYSDRHFNVLYTPENDAVNLLLNDSVRIAILSRDLNADEYKALHARNSSPYISRFAIDAVTLIVNQASNDTTITVSEIKKMLNGDTKKDKNIVFDNPNSGLVRYLKDLSGNREFKQKNIYALKSDKDVIRYVSEHPNAIGIVGFSWLNDPDKDYADAVQKVKIVGVKDDISKTAPGEYFTPSQNTLALKQYPLTRNLYILRNTSKLGLEFEAFLISDRGQRIILKSGLLPDNIPSRRISIQKKIKVSDK
jgi:phosphate transport system substrate-binding protein